MQPKSGVQVCLASVIDPVLAFTSESQVVIAGEISLFRQPHPLMTSQPTCHHLLATTQARPLDLVSKVIRPRSTSIENSPQASPA